MTTYCDNDAKTGVYDEGSDEKIAEYCDVEIAKILVNPYQPRHDSNDDITSLVESIKSIGVIQPPAVRRIAGTDTYELVAGERRLRAAKMAGHMVIPVIVHKWEDIQSAQAALIENIQRVDLNPIEVASALQNLIEEFDFSQEEIAGRIGKKRSTVSNYLRLLKLSKEIQDSLARREITMGHAKAILFLESAVLRRKLHETIVKQGLTVRQTEVLAAKMAEGTTQQKKKPSSDQYIEDLENRLCHALGTKVSIKDKSGVGAITIDYYNLDDLDRLLDIFEV